MRYLARRTLFELVPGYKAAGLSIEALVGVREARTRHAYASSTSRNNIGAEQHRYFTLLMAQLACMWPQLSSTYMAGRTSSNLNKHELVPTQVGLTTAGRCRCH